MSKSLKIDRVKLETALKKKFKTDRLKTISRAIGFKDNALNEALRRGTVSSKMSAALAKNGISFVTYELATEPEEALEPSFKDNADITPVYAASEPSQMSIDDLEVMRRSEIKSLIKEAVIELVKETEIRICNNPINHSYTAFIRVNGELVKKIEEVLL